MPVQLCMDLDKKLQLEVLFRLEEGNLAFTRMPKRDVISRNAMISGLSQNGYGKEALELFEEI